LELEDLQEHALQLKEVHQYLIQLHLLVEEQQIQLLQVQLMEGQAVEVEEIFQVHLD
jgi:hypothetical protein